MTAGNDGGCMMLNRLTTMWRVRRPRRRMKMIDNDACAEARAGYLKIDPDGKAARGRNWRDARHSSAAQ
jgi:hypothetical protein